MVAGTILATNAITAGAGAMIALATALAAAIAWTRDRAESRMAVIAAENEMLRDEVWRLRETAGGRSEQARRLGPVAEDKGGKAAQTKASGGATRVLVVAGSPSAAPPMAARLEAFGAEITRAEGLPAGLAALNAGSHPDLVIVDCALGAAAADELSSALRLFPGSTRSLLLASPFEPAASGGRLFEDFGQVFPTPVPAPLLSARSVGEFPEAPEPGVPLPSVVEHLADAPAHDIGLPRAS